MPLVRCLATAGALLAMLRVAHADSARVTRTGTVAVLAATVEKAHERAGFNGVVVVTDRSRALFQRAIGQADRQSRLGHELSRTWCWASVTKQVTALLVMQEVERGTLALDATLSEHLPDFAGPYASSITVQDLLQHTSGLPNPDGLSPDDHGVPGFYQSPHENARTAALGFCAGAPGAKPRVRFAYNNCDYLVLGAMPERINGVSFGELVEARIAKPLDLRSLRLITTASQAPHSAVQGYEGGRPERPFDLATYGAAGALVGTPSDLARLDRALLSHELLSAESTASMWRGEPSPGYAAFGVWPFPAKSSGCPRDMLLIEQRGSIGGIQVRNIIAPAVGRALIVFANSANIEFGELWQ